MLPTLRSTEEWYVVHVQPRVSSRAVTWLHVFRLFDRQCDSISGSTKLKEHNGVSIRQLLHCSSVVMALEVHCNYNTLHYLKINVIRGREESAQNVFVYPLLCFSGLSSDRLTLRCDSHPIRQLKTIEDN